ncbi:MAG: GspH/FimT family pseudopilin, partial [Pseudomonadota bacterium]
MISENRQRITNRPLKLRGVTFIELIATITIVGILAAMAIPSFNTMMQTNRFATQVNDLVGDFNLARNEAAKRGVPVTVCKDGGTKDCTVATAATRCWKSGWLVFVDTNGNNQIDTGEAVLRLHGPMAGTPSVDDSLGGYVSYLPNGTVLKTGTLVIYNQTCSTTRSDNNTVKIRR